MTVERKNILDKLAEFWPLILVAAGAAVGYLHSQWSTADLQTSFATYRVETTKNFRDQDKEADELRDRLIACEVNIEWLKWLRDKQFK